MRTVDLFAGCGGLSLGFQNAGFDIVAAFEYWDTAVSCYKNNFSHPIIKTDLSDVDSAINLIKEFTPDIIIGGPPCQDFSHAGKRIEAARASLTESYARIISLIKPAFFVMENVDRAQKSRAFEEARCIFKDSGYGLTEVVLNASLCGVPQKRKRFFCIGALRQPDGFMQEELLGHLSKKEMTLFDYFGDTLGFEYYYRHPRNYSRRAVFSIHEPAPTMRGVNRPVPKGYPGHPNDASPITENIRALTTLERALIQTFPVTYKWEGTKTDVEQMIGNAVPVKLAEYVATSLDSFIRSTQKVDANIITFLDWLISSKHYTQRTASDTVSRIKRATKMLPLEGSPDDNYLILLQKNNEFSLMSSSVKSQIKRALVLYQEYLDIARI